DVRLGRVRPAGADAAARRGARRLVRAGAPERVAALALAEREVGRERVAAVPGVADPLGHRRAVLEAVPGAAAEDPHARLLRVRGGDELRVGGELVAARLAAGERRGGELREAVG